MRKKFLIILIITTLLLDFAALDDITTGKEASFFWEYLMLIISIPILIASGYLIYRSKK